MSKLIDVLKSHDLEFYLRREKVSSAKQVVAEESGEKVVSKCKRKGKNGNPDADCSCFRCRVKEHCRYYLKVKRKSNSSHLELDTAGWERLKTFVETHLDVMNQLDMSEGVEFIKTKISTNEILVKGLPTRLHWWKNKS